MNYKIGDFLIFKNTNEKLKVIEVVYNLDGGVHHYKLQELNTGLVYCPDIVWAHTGYKKLSNDQPNHPYTNIFK